MSLLRPVSLWRGAALLVGTALAACGIDQGGIERPPDLSQLTVISGPITGFGSIHVNGLVLDTSGAQIRIDGTPAVEADLRRGQMIRAIALVGPRTSRAFSLEYQSGLVGPIAALDPQAGTLTVLGQRVRVNAATALDLGQAAALSDLSAADHVVVSGLRTPSGETLATYIGRASAGDALRITGSISAVDLAGQTFAIGDLTVDYSQVVLLQVPNGIPQAGLVVEVAAAAEIGGVIVATRVSTPSFAPDVLAANATVLTSYETPVVGTAGTPRAANLVGFITAAQANAIALADVDVTLGTRLAIVGGNRGALQVGVLVRVEGRVVGLGHIEADRITIL